MRVPRVGDWVQTATGQQFWPLDPRPEEVLLEDVAHALAHICRFGGHSRKFYSVAQHSILVSQFCPPKYALWGLLHDAAEAYIGDMTNPLKHRGGQFGALFQEVEERLVVVIAKRFGLSVPIPTVVREVDGWLLLAEARDLMGDPDWARIRDRVSVPPLAKVPTIRPWKPRRARSEFLLRFYSLQVGLD